MADQEGGNFDFGVGVPNADIYQAGQGQGQDSMTRQPHFGAGPCTPASWGSLPRVLQTKVMYLVGKMSNFDFEMLKEEEELDVWYYATIMYHGYPSILYPQEPPNSNWRLFGALYQGRR